MKRFQKMLLVSAAVLGAGLLAGCSTKLSPEPFDANLRLTPGQVRTTVKKGETTRLQIFKALGAPNVVAMESGKGEVWTYDQIKVRRTAQGYDAGAYFLTGFAFGDGVSISQKDPGKGAGLAGVSASGAVGTETTSIQTATLVIRFDTNDKVASYKMLVTSF